MPTTSSASEIERKTKIDRHLLIWGPSPLDNDLSQRTNLVDEYERE